MINKWEEMYKQKLRSADEAVKLVQPGDIIIAPLANGQPRALVNALAKNVSETGLRDITYVSGIDFNWFDIYHPNMQDKITVDCGFVGPATRHGVMEGYLTYTPCRLSELIDVVIVCRQVQVNMMVVAPMDKHGFFSTGCDVDLGWETAKAGSPRSIIVEVNENMPRTYGNNQLHINEVSAIVENHTPLVELPDIPINEKDKAIGHYIADMIENGACIQLGIGGIPNAIANFLMDRTDLGVHTEMLTDSMVDLYNAGAISCEKKNFLPYKWIASFALGSRKLYDFIDENPMIEMHLPKFVNDPYIVGKNDNVISVNATLEVDLTGQCASESIAHKQYSGTGGQLDFVQGSWRSKGGKSFLTLYSTFTDKNGNLQSKIVPTLTPGSFTTVSRTDVQYVVSEYGIADLKGQNVRTRVKELIKIAHPNFREQLEFEARKLNFIF